MNQRLRYGSYTIVYAPPPIPMRTHDWAFWHNDFDGAADANDARCGTAKSVDACKAEIDAIEEGDS